MEIIGGKWGIPFPITPKTWQGFSTKSTPERGAKLGAASPGTLLNFLSPPGVILFPFYFVFSDENSCLLCTVCGTHHGLGAHTTPQSANARAGEGTPRLGQSWQCHHSPPCGVGDVVGTPSPGPGTINTKRA